MIIFGVIQVQNNIFHPNVSPLVSIFRYCGIFIQYHLVYFICVIAQMLYEVSNCGISGCSFSWEELYWHFLNHYHQQAYVPVFFFIPSGWLTRSTVWTTDLVETQSWAPNSTKSGLLITICKWSLSPLLSKRVSELIWLNYKAVCPIIGKDLCSTNMDKRPH